MIKYKNFYEYSIYILIIIIFFLSFFQMQSQHWSNQWDPDWPTIYNILLMASGYEQEAADQPAFTVFFFSANVLKVYDFLNPNISFNIDNIHNIEDLNIYFEKIFYIGRIVNSLFHCASIYLIHLLLTKFLSNKILNLLLIMTLILSNYFLTNLFEIRPEIISVFFILFSFYIIIVTSENKKSFGFFIAGFLIGFAFISKIQILHFIFFIIFLIPLIKYLPTNLNKVSDNILINEKKLKLSVYVYFIICLFYLYLEYIIIYNHPRYINYPKYDLYGFIIFNFIYFFYLKIFSDNKVDFKKNIYRSILFFFGILFTALFLMIVDFINFSPVNHNIYFKFLNPIYFLTNRVHLGGEISYFSFLNMKIVIQNKFAILSILLFVPFFKEIFNLKKFYLIVSFGLIFLTILSNNLRWFLIYDIYTFVAFFIIFIFTIKKKFFYYRLSILILFLILSVNESFLSDKSKKNFFNRTQVMQICIHNNHLKNWMLWTKKFDTKIYERLCPGFKF